MLLFEFRTVVFILCLGTTQNKTFIVLAEISAKKLQNCITTLKILRRMEIVLWYNEIQIPVYQFHTNSIMYIRLGLEGGGKTLADISAKKKGYFFGEFPNWLKDKLQASNRYFIFSGALVA